MGIDENLFILAPMPMHYAQICAQTSTKDYDSGLVRGHQAAGTKSEHDPREVSALRKESLVKAKLPWEYWLYKYVPECVHDKLSDKIICISLTNNEF